MARKKTTETVRDRKREEIVDAAMAVFENDGGMEALSFRKLAAQLSLSYSAPYRYFANKEALINAMRARAYRWIEGVMLDAIAGIDDPEAQLEALAAAYIDAGIAQPDRYALMFFRVEDPSATHRSLELRAAKHDALDVCTRVIAAGQAAGSMPTHLDPLTASHLFWTAAHGLVSLQVAGQFEMGRNTAALVPALIGVLRAGVDHFRAGEPQHAATPEEVRHHG
jgi:AcrR family transcriptional regulator